MLADTAVKTILSLQKCRKYAISKLILKIFYRGIAQRDPLRRRGYGAALLQIPPPRASCLPHLAPSALPGNKADL